ITESVSELKGFIDDGPPWQVSTNLVAEFRLYPFPDRLIDAVSTVETGQNHTTPPEWMCSLDALNSVTGLAGFAYRVKGRSDRRVGNIT
ncbi:hypothetical protein, partial [Streptomyces sp. DSM 41634]|uniref:hypothetical protein n=1 Tax=Streptomyces sp. DSM 41634 TaxID=3448656 RepID=UPI0040403080